MVKRAIADQKIDVNVSTDSITEVRVTFLIIAYPCRHSVESAEDTVTWLATNKDVTGKVWVPVEQLIVNEMVV